MTAEQYYLNIDENWEMLDPEHCLRMMKEFAKFHVKEALKKAAEEAKVVMTSNCDDHTPYWGACVTCGSYHNYDIPTELVDNNSILNAYPENLII